MNYVYAIWCAFALLCLSGECFRVLQNASYKPQRGYVKLLCTPYFLSLVLAACFSVFWKLYFAVSSVLCGVYSLVALPWIFVRRKSPLKVTKRVFRMMAVQFVLLFAGCLFALYWWVVLLPVVTLLSWLICLPLDTIINCLFLKSACKKLKNSGVTVIAITGSFGKTTTKDMLQSLLSQSIAPSGSCNTPLGIAKFINSTNLNDVKFLILEFGARKKGDIAKLCKLYKPKYGIVTGVCAQHMSTFKTLQNVISTKRELVECLPNDGLCVLTDKSVWEFANYGVCSAVRGNGVRVSHKRVTVHGLEFTVSRGKKAADIHLPHIAWFASDTFATCATMCLKLGQSFDETVSNACNIKQCKHRMEISYNGKFFIVDDSYNANVRGVEACCKVLDMLDCEKTVISQGIVEGGRNSKNLNEQCGEMLGNVCNFAILLGKNTKYLLRGLKKTPCRVVLTAKNLDDAVEKAQPYLQKNSILLFQNDLPDVINV